MQTRYVSITFSKFFHPCFSFQNCLIDSSQFRMQTSRERHKSAPYLKLKNSKKTTKCQVFSFTVLEKQQPRIGAPGDSFEFFNIHSVAKHRKNEEGPFEKKNRKSLTLPKKN